MAASITLNGGWAVSRGVELAGAAGLTNALRLRGTWSYTRAALSQDSPGLLDGASKFDGVLGRSTQPKDNRLSAEATTPERQDCLPEGESSARHERRR